MEIFSNLIWVALCVALLGGAVAGLRRGTIRLPASPTLLLVAMLCLVLLPAISLSDDLLANDQADLPVAAQTWRLAMEPSALATEALLAVLLPFAFLLLGFGVGLAPRSLETARAFRPVARWLTRSQRLRPPLSTHA